MSLVVRLLHVDAPGKTAREYLAGLLGLTGPRGARKLVLQTRENCEVDAYHRFVGRVTAITPEGLIDVNAAMRQFLGQPA